MQARPWSLSGLGRKGHALLIFLLMSACSAGSRQVEAIQCVVSGGAPHLPEGWAYIEEESIDVIAGAYHDQRSGLFVEMAATLGPGTLPAPTEPAGSSVNETRVGHFLVKRVLLPKVASCQKHETWIRCSESPVASWRLSASVCSEIDRVRLEGLGSSLVLGGWPTYTTAKSGLTQKDVAALIGQSWASVRERIGRGAIAQGTPSKGFVVTYELGPTRASLEFDQEQRLSSVGVQP